MDPAYQIPLSDEALIMLGELTVILGQVDEALVRTVSGLIQADRETTNIVMGSTRVENNVAIWAGLIRRRHPEDLDLHWLVSHATTECKAVFGMRNDFIHADYQVGITFANGITATTQNVGETYRRPDGTRVIMGFSGPVVASKIRNQKKTSLTELAGLRARAGRLSCLVAHTGWRVAHGSWQSSWHERLGPELPPRPHDWQHTKAKGQQTPPRSSRPRRGPQK